jgi:Subtilase family
VTLASVLASCGGATGPDGTGAGSLPFDGRSPLVPPAKTVRVLVELKRPSLAAQMAKQSYGAGRQRAYVDSLGQEAIALQSALEAKNIRLRRPLLFARVWNGFAATVDTQDLPRLRALGLRAEPVRRFYGAAGAEGAGGRGQRAEPSPGGAGKPVVALLDSGVDRSASGLAGRVVPGFDAVGGDRDPRPAGLRERHGTQVAQVLAHALGARGGRILSIRVAGLQPDPRTGGRIEVGTTDQLLAGLERAVDPDGDGATDDHVPVALVGVNSPYAGFASSPEAIAAGAARALGTLVVAPAGNEGRGGGMLGTVGSPAAAPGVLAVGALDGGGAPALPGLRLGLATGEGRALLRGTLLSGGGGGGGRALRLPVATLAGPSQANPRERGRALGDSPLEYFAVNAAPRARGRIVVVPARRGEVAGPALSARAAAAAEAGAAALVVCEPDPGRALTAIPDGGSGIPVIGLRGSAAERALELTPHHGGLAFVSAPERRTAKDALAPAPSSSRGPSYALAPKPDIAAPGTATVIERGGQDQIVAGTSVAAARVAAAAARLHADRPTERPDDLIAALVGTARPLGPPLASGGGTYDLARAMRAAVLIEPATLGLPRQPAGAPFTVTKELTLHNTYSATEQMKLTVSVPGLQASVSPATVSLARNGQETVTLALTATGKGHAAGWVSGRLTARGSGLTVSAAIGLPIGLPPPARLGSLAIASSHGPADGVRFTAGAVTTKGDVRSVEPLGNLRLQLVDASGKVVRELTAPGGAPDLLPGEYAYTLTAGARKSLAKGSYSFVARGRGPAGGPELVRMSPSFAVR